MTLPIWCDGARVQLPQVILAGEVKVDVTGRDWAIPCPAGKALSEDVPAPDMHESVVADGNTKRL